MKILTTILIIALLGVLVWMYTQNNNLKNEKELLALKLDSAEVEASCSEFEEKISQANEKIDILLAFFELKDQMTEEKAKEIDTSLRGMGNENLVDNWGKLKGAKQGDPIIEKMIIDLLKAAKSDLN